MVDKLPAPAKGSVAKPVRTYTKTSKCGERSFPMSSPTKSKGYLITSEREKHILLSRSPNAPTPVAVPQYPTGQNATVQETTYI